MVDLEYAGKYYGRIKFNKDGITDLYLVSITCWTPDGEYNDPDPETLEFFAKNLTEAKKIAKLETDEDPNWEFECNISSKIFSKQDFCDLLSIDEDADRWITSDTCLIYYDDYDIIAEEVANYPNVEYNNVECRNYDHDQSIEGSIICVWCWNRFVGYAQEFKTLRYADYGETKRMLTPVDQVYKNQVSLVLTKEKAKTKYLREALIQELLDGNWKWTNPNRVKQAIDELCDWL